MSRLTVCRSWYSLMSRRTMFSSESNRVRARVLASSVFPTPAGPRRMNEPMGRAGVADAGAVADDGVADELDGLVLADDALAQDVVEAQQLLAFALLEAGDGDAGPGGDDLGDLLLGDDLAQQPVLPLFGGQLLLLGLQPALQVLEAAVAEFGGAVEVVGTFG